MERNPTATLEQVIAAIQRRWGTRALRWFGNVATAPAVPVVATGFAALDAALGIGGVPLMLERRLAEPTSDAATLTAALLALNRSAVLESGVTSLTVVASDPAQNSRSAGAVAR